MRKLGKLCTIKITGSFTVPFQVPSDNLVVPQGLKNKIQQNKKETSPELKREILKCYRENILTIWTNGSL